MSKINALVSLFLLTNIFLFLYSFTQVDLSLTLSQSSVFQAIEKQFQYIGFFQRPQSAIIFSVILVSHLTFYIYFLTLAKNDKLKTSSVKTLIFGTFALVAFSYNAFSYDLFNYIFDAKIFTFYHLNPYSFKPTDFPLDPMLNFMRWTHRVFPYGPTWLALTVPISFIGSNIFIFTFFLFKILIGASYLGCSFLIYKISEILFPKNKIFNTVFWSLNPLVIIEALVSAHNDFPMIFLWLLSFYLYLKRKKMFSAINYILSVGVKFSTGALLPLYAVIYYLDKTKKQINWEKIIVLGFLLSILTVIAATLRSNFQPWYLMFPFAIASFISKKYFVFIPVLIATLTTLLIYVTYVLITDYSPSYPSTIQNIEILGLLFGFTLTVGYLLKEKRLKI